MTLHSLTRLTTRLLILLQTFPRQTALFQFAQFIKRAAYFALALSASIAYGNDLTITPSSGNTERSELIKDLEREPIGLDGAALPPDYALQLEDIQIENFDLWERIRLWFRHKRLGIARALNTYNESRNALHVIFSTSYKN